MYQCVSVFQRCTQTPFAKNGTYELIGNGLVQTRMDLLWFPLELQMQSLWNKKNLLNLVTLPKVDKDDTVLVMLPV